MESASALALSPLLRSTGSPSSDNHAFSLAQRHPHDGDRSAELLRPSFARTRRARRVARSRRTRWRCGERARGARRPHRLHSTARRRSSAPRVDGPLPDDRKQNRAAVRANERQALQVGEVRSSHVAVSHERLRARRSGAGDAAVPADANRRHDAGSRSSPSAIEFCAFGIDALQGRVDTSPPAATCERPATAKPPRSSAMTASGNPRSVPTSRAVAPGEATGEERRAAR